MEASAGQTTQHPMIRQQHHDDNDNNDNNNKTVDLEQINFSTHASIPFALPRSELYEIGEDPRSGRGVFATTDLKHGTFLFRTNGTTISSCSSSSLNGIGVTTKTQESTQSNPRVYSNDDDESKSPLAYTIQREYRKEVCAECFNYDRGRAWKFRFDSSFLSTRSQPSFYSSSIFDSFSGFLDPTTPSTKEKNMMINAGGVVFCSENCRDRWFDRYGLLGVYLFVRLECALGKTMKKNKNKKKGVGMGMGMGKGSLELEKEKESSEEAGPSPSLMSSPIGHLLSSSTTSPRSPRVDHALPSSTTPTSAQSRQVDYALPSTTTASSPPPQRAGHAEIASVDSPTSQPTIEEIRTAWKDADITADRIRQARSKPESSWSKQERKLLRKASEPEELDSDICYYLLTAVLNGIASERSKQGGRCDIVLGTASRTDPIDVGVCKTGYESKVFPDEDSNCDVSEQDHGNDHICTEENKDPRSRTSGHIATENHGQYHNPNQDHNRDQKQNQYGVKHQAHNRAKNRYQHATVKEIYPTLLTLTADPECYAHPSSTLKIYTTSYLFLHSILPTSTCFHSDVLPIPPHHLSQLAQTVPALPSLAYQKQNDRQKVEQEVGRNHNQIQIQYQYQNQNQNQNQEQGQGQDQQDLTDIQSFQLLSSALAHELNARAAHNAFSIQPPPGIDGDQSGEFLGWGIWPVASLFNHSCVRNVEKVRRGRGWEFYVTTDYNNTGIRIDKIIGTAGGDTRATTDPRTDTRRGGDGSNGNGTDDDDDTTNETVSRRDRGDNSSNKSNFEVVKNSNKSDFEVVNNNNNNKTQVDVKVEVKVEVGNKKGQQNKPIKTIKSKDQLCITYLGGDEWDLDVVQRRKRLQDNWGFFCMCERCVREGQEI